MLDLLMMAWVGVPTPADKRLREATVSTILCLAIGAYVLYAGASQLAALIVAVPLSRLIYHLRTQPTKAS